MIAKSLQKSKQTIPHFYETIDVDIEELSAIRGRMNELLKAENIKLSISDFVAKAVAAALLKHPALNAHYSDDGITRFGDVNLGIAVAIPDGLIVPVLRGIDQMGLKEIRLRSEAMIQRARAGKQKKEDLGPGTFTISNLGTYGVREFSAIINPPEVAILAVASAEKRPVCPRRRHRRPHHDDDDVVSRSSCRGWRDGGRIPADAQRIAARAGDDAGVRFEGSINVVVIAACLLSGATPCFSIW